MLEVVVTGEMNELHRKCPAGPEGLWKRRLLLSKIYDFHNFSNHPMVSYTSPRYTSIKYNFVALQQTNIKINH